ncbi:MAG: small ribosomal subunit Rsm22 family protein [candidate division KSB1 bacterium]|nr:small ribosomal subunit Rsm22 family protein [candidate division KSB1 bacterium]MDZ7303616.1 small ribosomal subunit Rsm22 family protein [candidate division KSB1 bacterium]MDZ7312853.1 small ribosomal subunit Rsm22 family protein [candidate division KSB1 bacterium]
MMLSLPSTLENGVQEILKTLPTKQWAGEARALSQRYRGKRRVLTPEFVKGKEQGIAYLALILPATYAQLRGAMAATRAQAPDWSPQSLLDIGSGPGTAMWAAIEQWPSLNALHAWEREPAFIALGRELAQASEHAAVREAQWQKIDVSLFLPRRLPTFELVILGHVLNELNPIHRRHVINYAWKHCSGLLLIVEPGTLAAFSAVRSARAQLLASGARMLAPCPHEHPCPLVDDWCHFSQRLRRPQFQRRAKAALSQWEDCKFSYAAMARFGPTTQPWARIIREPQVTKAYVEVQLCTVDGITLHREYKKNPEAFKRTKKLPWGAILNEPLAATTMLTNFNS